MAETIREDVCIVLNEHQELKRQLAEELSGLLTKRGYSNSRLEAKPNVIEILLERSPRVLVSDYLLGDVGTVFDLFAQFENVGQLSQTDIVVWTDEPSVGVAVDAMKLGTYDYIEMDAQASVAKVIDAIEKSLRHSARVQFIDQKAAQKFPQDKLVAQSPRFRQTLAQASSTAVRSPNLLIVHGENGSGRSSIARLIHSQRKQAGGLYEIDFDVWPKPLEHLCGSKTSSRIVPLISHGATVFVDHADFDFPSLLEHLTHQRQRLWKTSPTSAPPMLILGVRSEQNAALGSRTLDAQVLTIPSLAERPEDFLPFVQRFLSEAQQAIKIGKPLVRSDTLDELSRETWPGNVRQLRACLFEASAIAPESLSVFAEPHSTSKKSKNSFLAAVRVAKEIWERYHFAAPPIPSPTHVRRALKLFDGNRRLAAIHLGTDILHLEKALEKELEISL